jgi:DNA-binding response OmpR family regulator
MNKIQILLVENTASMARPLIRKLEIDPRFDVSSRADSESALQLVQREEFDVLFIDLHLAERSSGEPIFDGISVGEAARKRLPNAVIVMYSQQIKAEDVKGFEHYEACKRAGADEIMARAPLFSLTQADLSALVDRLISDKRNAESENSHVVFDTGVRTLGAADTLGTTKLQRLLAKCVPNYPFLQIQAIRSGYSGAALFRVKAAADEKYTNALSLVVKVTESKFPLEDELQRRPEPGGFFASSSVVPHTHSIIEHDGLFAVSIAEVRKKHLLRDYLLEGTLTRTANKVLSRVVNDLLLAPARESRPADELNLPKDSYHLRPAAGSAIDEFLRESLTWTNVLKKADLAALQTTHKLVRKALDGHWNFTAEGRHVALLHGDFHCRNVFVSVDDSPLLIDFGRSQIYPRLFDFAALDADLMISLWDTVAGNDRDLNRVNEWYRSITKSFPFVASGSSPSHERIDFLRTALIKGLQQLPSLSRSEYAETVIFQLLRYLRFEAVPTPKKILAARLIENLSKTLHLD